MEAEKPLYRQNEVENRIKILTLTYLRIDSESVSLCLSYEAS